MCRSLQSKMSSDTKHANDVVTLCVGGKEFVTYFGTLANSRSPYFEYMFQVDRMTGRILINYQNIIVCFSNMCRFLFFNSEPCLIELLKTEI